MSIASGDSGAFMGEGEEEGEEEEESELSEDHEASEFLMWTGYNKKIPILIFKPEVLVGRYPAAKGLGSKFSMSFKMPRAESRIVRDIYLAYGFREVHPNSNDFNVMWTSSNVKPYALRQFMEFQKINHFPRSNEVTRKDKLYKNIQRMQQTKGTRHFDFIPPSFILPCEFQEFCTWFSREKSVYIVKPIASSRGRGIFLVTHPEQVPLDDSWVASKYLSNPLLIDGFKFDIRLYICVTSFDPLVIYLYEEGLTRFATIKYEKGTRHIRNTCMHLTNYSVNKKSLSYVQNDDDDLEDFGNKWSLGALLRHLRVQGFDTAALMLKIEDLIIKTMISVESTIATACKMFMPYRGNCFELYGFDVLVDENLKPWLLEVNLSPSLSCDSPLDYKIKTSMLCDLFTLVGLVLHDPSSPKYYPSNLRSSEYNKNNQRPRSASTAGGASASSLRERATSARSDRINSNLQGLTSEEIKIVRRAREEQARANGWVRIFPTRDSMLLYGPFLNYSTTHNVMLHQRLFGGATSGGDAIDYRQLTNAALSNCQKQMNLKLKALQMYPNMELNPAMESIVQSALERYEMYERRLERAAGRSGRTRERQPSVGSGSTAVGRRPPSRTSSRTRSSSLPPATSRTCPVGHDARQQLALDAEDYEGDDAEDDDTATAVSASGRESRNSDVVIEVISDAPTGRRSNRPLTAGRPPVGRVRLNRNTPESTRVASSSLRAMRGNNSLSPSKPANVPTGRQQAWRETANSGDVASTSKSRIVTIDTQRVQPATTPTDLPTGKQPAVAAANSPTTTSDAQVSGPAATEAVAAVDKEAAEVSALTHDIKTQLRSGLTLGKIQVRTAFSTYLKKLQHRLEVRPKGHSGPEDLLKFDQELQVVIRFLKRATSYLSCKFQVTVPSRRLALSERRIMLAKQLCSFVSYYDRDTDTLSLHWKSPRAESRSDVVPAGRFDEFLNRAGEREIEQVLTLFSVLHKSASVFLGTREDLELCQAHERANPVKSGTVTAGLYASSRKLMSYSEKLTAFEALSTVLSVPASPVPHVTSSSTTPQFHPAVPLRRNSIGAASTSSLTTTGGSGGSSNANNLTSTSSSPFQSSFQQAVAIYSSKASVVTNVVGSGQASTNGPNIQRRVRPSSASSAQISRTATDPAGSGPSAASRASHVSSNRPLSSVANARRTTPNFSTPVTTSRLTNSGATSLTNFSQSRTEINLSINSRSSENENSTEGSNDALQRLNVRQRTRNYVASRPSSSRTGSQFSVGLNLTGIAGRSTVSRPASASVVLGREGACYGRGTAAGDGPTETRTIQAQNLPVHASLRSKVFEEMREQLAQSQAMLDASRQRHQALVEQTQVKSVRPVGQGAAGGQRPASGQGMAGRLGSLVPRPPASSSK